MNHGYHDYHDHGYPDFIDGPSYAGPSSETMDSVRLNSIDFGEPESRRKRQKFHRSRTACFPCRTKKAKCGGQPPDSCPNCIESGHTCSWPESDGRSTRVKGQKRKPSESGGASSGGDKEKRATTGVGSGLPRVPTTMIDPALEELGNGTGAVSPRRQQHGGIPDELRGMGLDMGVGNGGHDGLTSGMGFGDPFWANQFTKPTMATPVADPHTASTLSQILPGISPSNSSFLNPNGVSPMGEFDIAQFVSAISSQMPRVQDASPQAGSSNTGPSPQTGDSTGGHKAKSGDKGGKIVKVSWFRPHGITAIAPGLKQYTLKVRVETPQETWRRDPHNLPKQSGEPMEEVIAPDGIPPAHIMMELISVFMIHFGSQFPCIDRRDLESKVHARTGSSFLLNSIAGIAARFSTHPAIALPSLQPWEYGNVFIARAKSMLGSMLSVPSRETVIAFILLAHCGFANDSESEVWMNTGLAVRMSYELGLQINIPESSSATAEERRLNKLTFWSVLLMDYALAFGVGRQTAIRPNDITQTLPTEDDIRPGGEPHVEGSPRSPFIYAAKMMKSYGHLINMLNIGDPTEGGNMEGGINQARAQAMAAFNELPEDMQWNVGNFQSQNRANQGSIFLHLHLWMHTILASRYLTDHSYGRREPRKPTATNGNGVGNGMTSGQATPQTMTVNNMWRNSARTIGDILVLSDIINPFTYVALPFVNQAFYVAGSCYVKEIEQHDLPGPDERNAKQAELSRALLASVAKNNISTLQQGLAKQNIYWSGAGWISGALEQRIEGIRDVDLVGVTEKLASYVKVPDAGLVGGTPESSAAGQGGQHQLHGGLGGGGGGSMYGDPGSASGLFGSSADGPLTLGDMDFSNWGWDVGGDTSSGSQNVTTQAIPLPQTFPLEWLNSM